MKFCVFSAGILPGSPTELVGDHWLASADHNLCIRTSLYGVTKLAISLLSLVKKFGYQLLITKYQSKSLTERYQKKNKNGELTNYVG